MISQTRLQEQLNQMAAITTHAHGAKGINRVAFTTTDWEGRRYLLSLMEEAGLEIRTDAFGNVIGHRRGTREDLPALLCGSHSDSVPEGGNYDGVCGILAAIEVARSMREDGFVNERPLEVVLFMCEESSRFGCSTAGSKFMRGFLTQKDLFKYHDKYGNSMYEVLQSRGSGPTKSKRAAIRGPWRPTWSCISNKARSWNRKACPWESSRASPPRHA